MREHPIPQDIVGYRFHIVGNMTIKQFAEIGTGVFIAFLLYQTNLIAFIKWPLMGLSVAIGAALAFVPFEERPLDHWLFTFVRTLYRPTKFYWRRHAKIPDAFLFKPDETKKSVDYEIDLSPARRQRIKEYMLSVNAPQVDAYDAARQQSINAILGAFDDIQVNQQATQGLAKPRLQVRVRSLRTQDNEYETDQTTIIEETVVPTGLAETSDYQDQLRQEVTLRMPLEVSQVAQDINIPEQQVVTAELSVDPQAEALAAATTLDASSIAYVPETAPIPEETLTAAAQFNQALPFPSTPQEPNKLVGMVLSPANDLINDAIIEIKAASGATVRAVKTNALGQFFVNTPLPNGEYTLEAEKDSVAFTPLSLTLKGDVVAPIEIRSIN